MRRAEQHYLRGPDRRSVGAWPSTAEIVVNTGRALVGIGFIALGTLFLLDEAGALDAGAVIADWWPAIFLVAAGLELLARPPRRIGALVFGVLGLLLLGATTGSVAGSMLALLWPLAVIALGAWLLVRRPTAAQGATVDSTFDAAVLFSGRALVNSSQDFRGGNATAVFGGVEVDLTGARILDTADVEAVAVFGGVDLKVPPGWRVVMDGPAIFGGNENKVPTPTEPDAPTLRVRSTAIFGGVEVGVGAAWPAATRT